MSKKIICSIAPILVLVVFTVAPAMATVGHVYGTCAAGTPETKPPCKAGEHFTAFPFNTPEAVVIKGAGTGKFILKNKSAHKAFVECETLSGKGTIENKENEAHEVMGITRVTWVFGGCIQGGFGIIGCNALNPETNHEITLEPTEEIKKNGSEIHVSLPEAGPYVYCETREGETETLGPIWGTLEGKIHNNVVEFNEAPLSGGFVAEFYDEWVFTGKYETETEAGKVSVRIH